MPLKILFMGTPQFGKEFLEHIYLSKNFSVQAVYTQPPKKSNRGQKLNLSPVHKFAKENRINIFCPEKFSKIDIDSLIWLLVLNGEVGWSVIIASNLLDKLLITFLKTGRVGVVSEPNFLGLK